MRHINDALSYEAQVLAALPIIRRHAQRRGRANLERILRDENIPYGIAGKACQTLGELGVLKNEHGAWVLP